MGREYSRPILVPDDGNRHTSLYLATQAIPTESRLTRHVGLSGGYELGATGEHGVDSLDWPAPSDTRVVFLSVLRPKPVLRLRSSLDVPPCPRAQHRSMPALMCSTDKDLRKGNSMVQNLVARPPADRLSRPSAVSKPATSGAAVAGTTWKIDPIHSTIGFSVKQMLVVTVHGRFGGFQGMIRIDEERPRNALVEVQIDAATIDTNEKRRDEHLRSADFFDVAAHPTITFRSTRVDPISPLRRDRWLVVGDLTIHGVTRSVKLAVVLTGGGPNPWDAEVTSFAVTTMISRKDFGLGPSLPLAKGLVIGDDVTIAIYVQAQRGPDGDR